jgi:heme exporter protein D
MEHANHLFFIVGAYLAAAVVVMALIIWVLLDYRAQRRALAELESKGLRRRSEAARRGPRMERAKEQA